MADLHALGSLALDRASDQVHEMLREKIVQRVFVPGERLRVDEIAGQLGVSRTPVIEALKRLEGEGLVEIRPRKGTFVTELSVRDIEEIFDLRRALECSAGEVAAKRITGDELRHLEALAAVDAARTAEDAIAHERANEQFHRLIVEASRNRRLIRMYDELNALVHIVRIHRQRGDWKHRVRRAASEHRAIVEALQKGDVAATIGAISAHLIRGKTSLLSDLGQDSPLSRFHRSMREGDPAQDDDDAAR